MLQWLLATIKRRAVCAERCTYGSERRSREIVRLRSASYSTPLYFSLVHRAFLCGEDKNTGHNFDHRRGWVEDKLLSLTQVFAIDVCAYTVMSNHTHTVLFIDEETAKGWSIKEVIERWHQLFKGTLFTQRYCRDE